MTVFDNIVPLNKNLLKTSLLQDFRVSVSVLVFSADLYVCICSLSPSLYLRSIYLSFQVTSVSVSYPF